MVQSYSPGCANVPSHEDTFALPGEYDWTCASFSPPKSTTQTANRLVQPFLQSSQQTVAILYNGLPFFTLELPLPWWIWTPSTTIPWAHLSPQPKQHLNRFSLFRTDDCRVSLYFTMGRPLPIKIAHLHGECGLPSNTWFPGSTQVLNPNGISIASAVFTGLNSARDRLTDHTTWSVTIGRIYICSTGDAA